MENLNDFFRDNYKEENIENILLLLRQKGVSQFDSLKTICNNLNLSLKAGDDILLKSKTWSDKYNENVGFRNDFADFVENLE